MSYPQVQEFLTEGLVTTAPNDLRTDKLSTVGFVPEAELCAVTTIRLKPGCEEAKVTCTTAPPLKEGCVSVWRFASSPEASSPSEVGLSAELANSEEAEPRGIYQNCKGEFVDSEVLLGRGAAEFGPGSVVDWYLNREDNLVTVSTAVDGEFQGPAFSLDLKRSPEWVGRLRPSVRLGSQDEVKLYDFRPVPSKKNQMTPNGPFGCWSYNGSEEARLKPHLVVLHKKLGMRLSNEILANASIRDDGTMKTSKPSGSIFSTRKLLMDPALQALEELWTRRVADFKTWKVEGNGDSLLIDNTYCFERDAQSTPSGTPVMDLAAYWLTGKLLGVPAP